MNGSFPERASLVSAIALAICMPATLAADTAVPPPTDPRIFDIAHAVSAMRWL